MHALGWPARPWFLDDSLDSRFEAIGLPRQAREAAARNLGRLLAEDLTGQADDGGFFAAPLLRPSRPEEVAPLLEVGLDLEAGEAWDDEHLLARLRSAAEWEDAALELRVFANASRGGFRPRRIPRSQGRTADFLVTIGHTEEYELEVKGRREAELVKLADELNQRVAAEDLSIPGLHLELQGSSWLCEKAAADRKAFVQDFDTIVGAFAEAVRAMRAAGAKAGTYEVGKYGRILATSGGQSFTPAVLADVSVELRAAQAARLVRHASTQVHARKGIVFVDVRRHADLAAVGRAVLRDASKLGKLRMVVVADTLVDKSQVGRLLPVALPVAVPVGRALSKALQAFAAAVAGRRGFAAQLLSEDSSTGHARRGVTVVKLTDHYRQADGTFRVSVNDLVPGVHPRR